MLPVLLVVAAAVIHATWNLMAKRAAEAGAAFVVAYNAIICVIYAPAAWLLSAGEDIAWTVPVIICFTLNTLINLAYALCLQHGYRVADLSVVYPVARGTGPMFATLGAIMLLGEVPSALGLLGLAGVIAGIVLISTQGRLSAFLKSRGMTGLGWGLATGILIAGYSVVDAWGVKTLGIPPVLLVWLSNVLRFPVLLPVILRDRRRFLATMRGHWGLALGVALLAPLSYFLVLSALGMGAPLSVVAPLREMSMMVAVVFGLVVLRERVGPWHFAGCTVLSIGVACLVSA
ncbi:MAG TPA: DMT family transporter [Novosphingobium sp.]|nr:DMT family transporter [Novosphingobium sp.]